MFPIVQPDADGCGVARLLAADLPSDAHRAVGGVAYGISYHPGEVIHPQIEERVSSRKLLQVCRKKAPFFTLTTQRKLVRAGRQRAELDDGSKRRDIIANLRVAGR
jgi:hypothetical protein